jgi:hypothetical protein
MVQPAFDRMQARLDVAKTFAIGELCESHGQILIQFDSYACMGDGGTKNLLALRNPLYHPSSSVFFFDLLYLESFFKSENLTGFDIDAVALVSKPDCIDYP